MDQPGDAGAGADDGCTGARPIAMTLSNCRPRFYRAMIRYSLKFRYWVVLIDKITSSPYRLKI